MLDAPPSGERTTAWRDLVLPKEHGSWALAFEPLALGLLVAPSAAAGWLGLATAAGFLCRRPLKLAVTLPVGEARRSTAARWAAALIAVAFTGVLLAARSGDWRALWPLLLGAPAALLFLWFDLRNAARDLESELAGSSAFALVPAACGTLAGWSAPAALVLSALCLARTWPTILAVRAFLRRKKNLPAHPRVAAVCAFAAAAGSAALFAARLAPWTVLPAALLLLARNLRLLFFPGRLATARQVGIGEAVIGVIWLGLLAAGFQLA